MNTLHFFIVILLLASVEQIGAQVNTAVDTPRPIQAGASLWTEELTWMEVRDAVKSGNTTIIIGTGGVEQNGPYVAGGKHNYVLQTVLPYIARSIPNSLIAPIVKFVPEGQIEPNPTDHMTFPGTISLEEATFEALLTDICRSYKAHGFEDIILVGDSGGNQKGMENVAKALNERWKKESARVHYLAEYYTEDRWSYNFLKTLGVTQIDKTAPPGKQDQPSATRNNIHDDIYYEAQVAVQDPALIRAKQRQKAGLMSLHGVSLSVDRLVDIGKKLAEYRAEITARAFKNSLSKLRTPPGTRDRFLPVSHAIERSPVKDVLLLIGNRDGRIFTYQKGNMSADRVVPVASAAKLLAGATLFRLVEAGHLALDDRPQKYLKYWTDDPADQRSLVTLSSLLSLTSGFSESDVEHPCLRDPETTTTACAEKVYRSAHLNAQPGRTFSYGPLHFILAAAMAEAATGKRFEELFNDEIARPLGMRATAFDGPSRSNPRIAGGVHSTAEDYERFLRALVKGTVFKSDAAFFVDRTKDVTFARRPRAVTQDASDWHYGLGAWLECDGAFSRSCADSVVISSPGAYGWVPWFDPGRGYYG